MCFSKQLRVVVREQWLVDLEECLDSKLRRVEHDGVGTQQVDGDKRNDNLRGGDTVDGADIEKASGK